MGLPASLRRGGGNSSSSGLIIDLRELEGLGLLDGWRQCGQHHECDVAQQLGLSYTSVPRRLSGTPKRNQKQRCPVWTRGNHDMTLSSTRTSAAGEDEWRGGVRGDRAGREKGRADRADVQPDNRHIDRHADMRRRRDRQTDRQTQEERESQESKSHRLGSGFDLCLCPSRRSFHVDPAPYNAHVHTTHLHGQHAMGPITWWVSVRGRHFRAGKGTPQISRDAVS